MRAYIVIIIFFLIAPRINAQLYQGWQFLQHDVTFAAAAGISLDSAAEQASGSLEITAGYFVSDRFEAVLRSGTGMVGSGDNSRTPSAVRFGLDMHFSNVRFYPFMGVHFGYLYGKNLQNSAFWGPEIGFKYFLTPRCYVHTLLEYNLLFERGDADQAFNNGKRIFAAVGVGIKW